MRRLALLSLFAALTACAPDPLLGTFTFTLTGTDTETAPRNVTASVTGMGTLAITTGKTVDYVITLSHTDADACVLEADRDQKGETVSLTVGQKCTFTSGAGTTTATLTSGTVTGTEKGETVSIAVNYSYTATALGINFAGTGVRTYAGVRR
jgi:hypothetical protein